MNKTTITFHYIQTETCWIIKETGEKIPYGEITTNYDNFSHRLLKDYNNSMDEIPSSNARSSLSNSEQDVLNTLHSLLFHYLLNNDGKIENASFTPLSHPYLSSEKQLERQKSFANLVRENGWLDFPDNFKIPLIDVYLLKCLEDLSSIPTLFCYYDYKWYPSYELATDDVHLIFLDIMQIRNSNLSFNICKECGDIFIQNKKNIKYCPKCRKNYKSIKDKEYSKTPRGIHKRVLNYMRNMHKFTQAEISDFSVESDYYWNYISGKEPPNTSYEKISTNEQYTEWLKKKHAELKKIAKTRPANSGY